MTIWGIPSPPQFLEYDEVRRIINWVTVNSKHKYRDVLLLEALWESGGRVAEVLSLVPEGIGTNSLFLPNLKQKKKKQKAIEEGKPLPYKEVTVSPELCTELKEFSISMSEGFPIFRGNKNSDKVLNYRYVYRLITNSSGKLGIIRGKKRKLGSYAFTNAWPHLFRHASAMRILDETGDLKLVQRQLGHASIVTTQMYAEIRPEKAEKSLSEVRWRE